MEIHNLRRPSIVLLAFGFVFTGISVIGLFNPQNNTIDMIFLSMFGSGLFMLGLGFSILNQIRKIKT